MKKVFFLLSLCPMILFGLDLSPWLLTALYPENRFTVRYEGGKRASNFFLHDRVKMTIWPDYELQGEIDFAKTRDRRFGFSSIDLAGSTLFFNEEIGDPISLKGTVAVGAAVMRFVKDKSLFEPGPLRIEGHLSLGKELYSFADFKYRGYFDLGYGMAERGGSWFSGEGRLQKNLYDRGVVGATVRGLWQCAGKEALELLATYQWNEGPMSEFSVEIGARLCARRLPHAALFQLNWSIPFGLGI